MTAAEDWPRYLGWTPTGRWEKLAKAADLAHAQHDGRTPRRLCRQEMCRLFDEAGVPDR
jgi:hypothetical protein